MRFMSYVVVLIVVLSGCVGGNLDTPEKVGVAFCSSFASVMQKLALFRQTGNLDDGDVLQINRAVVVIEPYCTGPMPDAPTASILTAFDVLLLIQLNKGS